MYVRVKVMVSSIHTPTTLGVSPGTVSWYQFVRYQLPWPMYALYCLFVLLGFVSL